MTQPLTKTDAIRLDVARHPGATNKDVARRTGLDANLVSAITGAEAKAGRMTRTVVASTISNVKIYAYWPVVANVSKPPENVSSPPPPKPAPKPRPRPPAPSLDGLLDQFASAIALELTGRIKERLVEELQQAIPTPRPDTGLMLEEITQRIAQNLPAAPKDKLRTVVVAGLLPQQAGMIQSEFHDAFDLKFWADGVPSQLKALVRNADHVITFSGKLGHHVEETIKSTGKDFIRIMGGMTQLRDTLTTLYVKEDG